MASEKITTLTDTNFDQSVIKAPQPVLVDFWAEWCGPCRTLGPALEAAIDKREGNVELAKLDTDANQSLAASFQIRGIPAVKAFKDGRLAAEFTGAIPPAEVERFFDGIVPSEAELGARAALESGDETALRDALAADPRNAELGAALGRILLARGDHEEALQVVEPFEHDFAAGGLAARARLALAGHEDERIESAFAAWDAGDRDTALEELQRAFAAAGDPETRDAIRRIMVTMFTELGPQSELAREHRRRLSAVLN
jgi:putative thioredoxin